MRAEYAPIALFAYKRPDHTRSVLEALARNTEAAKSTLIVYSDAPASPAAESGVQAVRNVCKLVTGFADVRIIEQEKNLGLAQSIIAGVTSAVDEFGQVIVLEDDLVVAPHFLEYMNNGLTKYKNDERVISLHAYNYPLSGKLPDAFFVKGADCWGWATWKRGWDLFESDSRKLIDQIYKARLKNRFDFFGAYPYMKMLKGCRDGKNQSWAIRWYASALLKGKLTLYPSHSLIKNIGMDGTGAHFTSQAQGESMWDVAINQNSISLDDIPVIENQAGLMAMADFLRKANPGRLTRLKKKMLGLFGLKAE